MLKKIILGISLIMNTTYTIHNTQAVVLAAGRSSRFGKSYSKMLAEIHKIPLIVHALRPLQKLDIPKIVIVGFQRDKVQQAVLDGGITNVQFVVQEEQRGGGHAVACAQPAMNQDHILITYGDMPLLTADFVEKLYAHHTRTNADITFTVAHNEDPKCRYGRIVPTQNGTPRIIEYKHFDLDIHEYPLVNAGIYLIKQSVLNDCLAQVPENNETHEIYLTDVIEIAGNKNLRIETIQVPFDSARGINTQEEFDSVVALVNSNQQQTIKH